LQHLLRKEIVTLLAVQMRKQWFNPAQVTSAQFGQMVLLLKIEIS